MIFHKFQRSTVFYRGRGKSRFKIKEAFMSDKKRTLFFQKKKYFLVFETSVLSLLLSHPSTRSRAKTAGFSTRKIK
jgi:ribosomal protein L15E